MKTRIISAANLSLGILLLTGLSILTSCVKEDNTPPVITIIGPASVNAMLGTLYVDQGATANDNEDGVITNFIIVNNPVNIDLKGVYSVTYTATDKAGNSTTVARVVHVINSVDGKEGMYSISGIFNGITDNNYTSDTLSVSATINNRLVSHHFAGFTGASIGINFNDTTVYVPPQDIVCGSDQLSRIFVSTSGSIQDVSHFTISGTVALTSSPLVTTPWSYTFSKN